VDEDDLNAGLSKLGRPALQFCLLNFNFRAESGWTVTVHGGPGGPVQLRYDCYFNRPDLHEWIVAVAEEEVENRRSSVDPRMAFLEEGPPADLDPPRRPFDAILEDLKEHGSAIPEDLRASVAHLSCDEALSRYREWLITALLRALADASIPHRPEAVRSVLLWEGVTTKEEDSGWENLPRLLSVLGFGGKWDEIIRDAETPRPVVCDPPD
jgi:hypothetical protein